MPCQSPLPSVRQAVGQVLITDCWPDNTQIYESDLDVPAACPIGDKPVTAPHHFRSAVHRSPARRVSNSGHH
jgi:hypothetical protein